MRVQLHHVADGLPACGILGDLPVMIPKGCDLRRMGHDQNLTRLCDRRQTTPDRIGRRYTRARVPLAGSRSGSRIAGSVGSFDASA